ncbi:outer membrane protein OmpA-like peptidoglycan-associated protein [Flavobacterium arsenatis]|uniref:Outer membrane protein OmpA-like peptidoglycan-associated protein n=1 Tax=Flavobacterium arsenatis TaxID=1484332 RepID=A0ABU1TLN3_9FLAO|nr:OmpA family protein [Flavobacterium arsenatis]MDR6966732.1 outer membrane protein OmpA-like peptidoglycan-associated protein [Flavobacterium arsenatis]
MKRNTYLLLLILISQIVLAQKNNIKKADKLFADKAYVEAAKLYEKAGLGQHVLENLGDCYYFNNEMNFAEKPYANLISTYKDSVKPVHYFRYANVLNGIGNSERADAMMSKYRGFVVDTKKFKQHLNSIVPYNYTIKKLSKNSDGDFGIGIYGDKIIFASLRSTSSPKYHWNGKPYLDLFEATISKDGMLENIKPFSKEINTKTHESSAVFTKDKKTMYFNRTSDKRVEVGEEVFASVKIFRAELVNEVWTNVTEMPFSSDQFSTQHPALSPDEKKIYFSSDRPDSLGSFDIYYADIYEDGTYGEPVNLGNNVNTQHREQFPFMAEDNTLYFASDGHQGMGGLDLFMARSYDEVYAKPINLGETINTGRDDFSFVLKEADSLGYFSSNRDGGDDLFAFERSINPRRFTVEGDVRDKNTKELLPGTVVKLYDDQDKLIVQIVVGKDADYVFNSEPNKKYKIVAERDFYASKVIDFETKDDGQIRFNIELEIESYEDAEEIIVKKDDGLVYIELENIYFDFNKWEIKPEAANTLNVLVDIMKKYPRMEIELGAHTDSRASDVYNLRLSHNRANAALEFLVKNGINKTRIKSKGYGKRVQLIKCGDDCTETEHSINRRCEFIILK